MHVKICKEIKPGWKSVRPGHLCTYHKAFLHPGAKGGGLFLMPKELATLLLHEAIHPTRERNGTDLL